MLLNWFNAHEATEVGTALADDFVLQTASSRSKQSTTARADTQGRDLDRFMQKFLQRVDRETRPLQLNLFKRAKLANSFKWRLLEKGVEPGIVAELTQALVLHLSPGHTASTSPGSALAVTGRTAARNAQALLVRGTDFLTKGAYEEAAGCLREFLDLNPRHAVACNNLGVALIRLGSYEDAEAKFRRAVAIKDSYADAQANLGTLLRSTGRVIEAEAPLRRALKLKPTHTEAQVNLGFTLLLQGRVADARAVLERVLKSVPRNVDALVAMGEVEMREGRFAEAEAWYRRALEADPKTGGAWVGLVGLRKMTPGDSEWLGGAEGSLISGLAPISEGSVRFAIGKYYDDVGQFAKAFSSYQRANELWRVAARPYSRDARKVLVDRLIGVYTREALCAAAHPGASDSALPVFVVGMPRAGTSLVEQIIASHPAATGAGELEYWNYAVRKHETMLLQRAPDEALTRKLAEGYLKVLGRHRAERLRVVDKAPVNCDFLGPIHCVFPNARVVYVRRDPIDVCLSCYFQSFAPSLNFTFDLSDLAHYYREHVRLMAHWRAALPSGTLLDVPYEELVSDQERWTRRILDFLGLEWDPRCLQFHETKRPVGTASVWQVRQKLYKSSVGRWRHYEKFIGPLLELKDLR